MTTQYSYSDDELQSAGPGTRAQWDRAGMLSSLQRDGFTYQFRYHANGKAAEVTRTGLTAVYGEDYTGDIVYRKVTQGAKTATTYVVGGDYEVTDYGNGTVLSTKTIDGPFGPAVAITEAGAVPPQQTALLAPHDRRMRARLYGGSSDAGLRARSAADRFLARIAVPSRHVPRALALALAALLLFVTWRGGRRGVPVLQAAIARVLLVTISLHVALPAFATLTPGPNGPGNPVIGERYFLQDQVGSTISVTDGNGNETASLKYLPFGVLEGSSTGVDDFQPKFGGYRFDEASTFYDFGSRFLDPRTGRFTRPDPAHQYMNPYLYGRNNPASAVDPDGEFAFIPALLIAVGVVGGAYAGGAAVNGSANPAEWNWESGTTYAGILLGGAIGAVGGAVVDAAFASSVAAGIAGSALVGAGEGAAFAMMGGGSPREVLEAAIQGGVFGAVLAGAGAVIGRGVARIGRGARAAEGAEEVADEGARATCASFPAGQKVLMADGRFQPVESVRRGDEVEALQLHEERRGDFDVTATIQSSTARMTRITTGSGATIDATPAHQFRGFGVGWIPASELNPAISLVDDRGNEVRIRSVETWDLPRSTPVYNFTVDEAHDYYVSDARVLVHNMLAPCARLHVDQKTNVLKRPGFSTATKRLVMKRQTRNGLVQSAVKYRGVPFVRMKASAKIWIGKKNPRQITAWGLDHDIPWARIRDAIVEAPRTFTWKEITDVYNDVKNLRYITAGENGSHVFEPAAADFEPAIPDLEGIGIDYLIGRGQYF